MAKVDQSNSFMSITINEEFKRCLGIKWKDQRYRFTRAVWGCKSSPVILTSINNVLMEYVKKRCPNVDINLYIDDFILCGNKERDVN